MAHDYNFYVKDATEVDIPRILAECPAEQDAILLVSVGCAAMLLLRESFVNRFSECDKQVVSVGALRQYHWGYDCLSVSNEKDGVSFFAFNGNVDAKNRINGWKAQRITKTDIDEVMQQLAKARAFVPRRHVRVSYI